MIIVRSPLRISFAGGGTDMREYYQEGFGAVCSMAINKYVYVTVNNLSIYFPHRFRIAYSQTELVQEVESIRHPIVREALQSMKIDGGIDINVMADIPAGTGMGSSSTFTVSLLHALSAFQNKLASKECIAQEASSLEIDVLKEPIGKQDQYAAAFGGLNLFRFHSNEQVSVEPLPISADSQKKIRSSLMLFYLGGHREASKILKSQNSKINSNRSVMNKMRDQALEVAQVLAQPRSNYDELGKILNQGWELKKQLAEGITNPVVDENMNAALDAGALGGKLLGAGGTGFLLFYVPQAKHNAVRSALKDLKEVHFEIDHLGSTLLYYGN